MKNMKRILSPMLINVLVVHGLISLFSTVSTVNAQHRAIVVSAEQPNVWTLEQAHYLLAQMHRRNLDLKATGVGELDPNEINGLNFDVLRTLLEFGVEFDDAARFNNSLLKTRKGFDADRAIKLQKRRDELADESLKLNRDIARLSREQTLADTHQEKDRLGAQVAELTAVRDGVDKEVARLDEDIKSAGGPSGDVQATDAQANFDPTKLPKSTFDDAFKDVTKRLIDRFNEAPKLNATIRLDNFLQMQYEIIAKQLTLLRDEVGPGERIIFLEMPQTVNASYDKANNKWAQSWWNIAGYTTPKNLPKDTGAEAIKRLTARADVPRTMTDMVKDAIKEFSGENSTEVNFVPLKPTGRFNLQDRSVRTMELIPRQSSLNVNDIKLRARSGVLTAVAKTLFGFGARLNFQRQRETFSQFVQQELYSSGFGKGSTEFGWTFTPMPGTERVMSGTRTTYAVLVVPTQAETLVIQSTGCYFPRADYQPISFSNTSESRWTSSETRRCSEQKAFVVPIPAGGDGDKYDFWVDALEYVPAGKGDRVVLSIYGRNFPAQIGVLIDGVPLTQAIGIAQPLIRDDSAAFRAANDELREAKVIGTIERVDSHQLVAVFERPNGRDGTQPVITLTAPGKAKTLNFAHLYINSTPNIALNDETTPLMFGKRAKQSDFRIDRVELFRGSSPGFLRAIIRGGGFEDSLGNSAVSTVLVNGAVPARSWVDSSSHMGAEFRITSDEKIRITLISRNIDPTKTETAVSDPVANPAFLRIDNVTVVSYEPATENVPATLVVKIEGSGFNEQVQASIGELAIKSATEAILKINNPEAAAVVTFTDRETGRQVKTIITRSTAQK